MRIAIDNTTLDLKMVDKQKHVCLPKITTVIDDCSKMLIVILVGHETYGIASIGKAVHPLTRGDTRGSKEGNDKEGECDGAYKVYERSENHTE